MPSTFLSNMIQALRESKNILCICGVNIGFHAGKNLSYLEDFSCPLLAFFFFFFFCEKKKKNKISRNLCTI